MSSCKEINWYMLIRRNLLLLMIKILKSLFFILISGVIYYFRSQFFVWLIEIEWIEYIFFSIVFLLLNYAFLNLISSIVEYYNDLIILHKDQIIILKSSLILKDDMEIIDIYKVMKIDWFKRGLLQNILWYGNIIIEQQKDDVRVFHFISNPHNILKLLRMQKEEYKINLN
jgi:hypothetical protein